MYRIAVLLSAASIAFAEQSGAPLSPVDPAGSGGAPGTGGAPAAAAPQSPYFFIVMMVGVFAFMYFVMIRPQRKEEKRRKEMLSALKRGDKVVTIGGVHGTVETVGEQTIDVRVGSGSDTIVATFNKGAVNANMSAEAAVQGAEKSGKK